MVYNIVMHYTFDVFTMTLFTNLLTTSSSTWNCCNFHCNWLFLLCTFNALITNRTWIPFFLITKDIFREGSVKLNSKILFHVSFFGCFTQTMQRVNTTGVILFFFTKSWRRLYNACCIHTCMNHFSSLHRDHGLRYLMITPYSEPQKLL